MNNKLVFVLISLAFAQILATAEDNKEVKVDITPEKKIVEEKVGATLKEDAKLKPEDSTDVIKDETSRKKKSTTTFCVEIRPSGSYQPFELCEKENNELKRPPFGEPAYPYLPPPAKVVYPSYSAVRDEPKPAYAKQIPSPYSPPPPPAKSIYSSYGAPQKSPPPPAYAEVKQPAYQASKKLISYGPSASEEVKSGASSFSKSGYQASKQIENGGSSQSSSFDQPQSQQYRSKEEVPPPPPAAAPIRVEEAPNKDSAQRSNEPVETSNSGQSVSLPRESTSEQRSNEETLQTPPEQGFNPINVLSSRNSDQASGASSTPVPPVNNVRESEYGEPEYSAPAKYDAPEFSYIPVIKPSLKNVLLQKLSKKISGLTVSCQPYVKYVKGSSGNEGYSAYRSAYGSDSPAFGPIEEDEIPVPAVKDVPKTTKTVLYSIPLIQSDFLPQQENDYGGQSRGTPQISAYIPIQISEQFVPIPSPPAKVVPPPASPSAYSGPSPNSAPAPAYGSPAPIKVTPPQVKQPPAYHQQSYHAPRPHSAPAQYAYSAPVPQKSFSYAAPSYSNFKAPPTYKQSEEGLKVNSEAKKTEEAQLKTRMGEESQNGEVVATSLSKHRGLPDIIRKSEENGAAIHATFPRTSEMTVESNGMSGMGMMRGNQLVPIELLRRNEEDGEAVAAASANQEKTVGSMSGMGMMRGNQLVPIELLRRNEEDSEAVAAASANQEMTVGSMSGMGMMRGDRLVPIEILRKNVDEGNQETVGNPTFMEHPSMRASAMRDRLFNPIIPREHHLFPIESLRGQTEESLTTGERVGSPTNIILNEDPFIPIPIIRANEGLTQNMMRSRWNPNSVIPLQQGHMDLVKSSQMRMTGSEANEQMTENQEPENEELTPKNRQSEATVVDSRATSTKEDNMRKAEEMSEVKVQQDEPQNGQVRSSDVSVEKSKFDNNVEHQLRNGWNSGRTSNSKNEENQLNSADEMQRRNQDRTEVEEQENGKARTAFLQNPLTQIANAAENVAALIENGKVITTEDLKDVPQQTVVNPSNMF